jgi:hypothetical protein
MENPRIVTVFYESKFIFSLADRPVQLYCEIRQQMVAVQKELPQWLNGCNIKHYDILPSAINYIYRVLICIFMHFQCSF